MPSWIRIDFASIFDGGKELVGYCVVIGLLCWFHFVIVMSFGRSHILLI